MMSPSNTLKAEILDRMQEEIKDWDKDIEPLLLLLRAYRDKYYTAAEEDIG